MALASDNANKAAVNHSAGSSDVTGQVFMKAEIDKSRDDVKISPVSSPPLNEINGRGRP